MKMPLTMRSVVILTALSIPSVLAQNFTDFPTPFPTAQPTALPITPAPTDNLTFAPTPVPTTSPTALPTAKPSPRPTFKLQEHTVENLSIRLFGISSQFSAAEVAVWQKVTAAYQARFWANVLNPPIQDFAAEVTITTLDLPTPVNRRGLRQLQGEAFVTVYFTQTITYRLSESDPTDAINPIVISTFAFEAQSVRDDYVDLLQQSDQGILVDIIGSSIVTTDSTLSPTTAPIVPTTAPAAKEDDELPLSLWAIIGIGVGGGFCVLSMLFFFCCRTGKDEQTGANDPPPTVNIKGHSDEVSTLAPPPLSGRAPAGGYGDQSVATVDYDYSKAYGGGGDAVSSAGGTFGSQTGGGQSVFDSRMAGPSGGVLGSFSDADSFDAGYRDPVGNTKDLVLNIFAPPGKLGVVIDTPDDGAPVVHAVKDTSVIADQINVGDKLIAVDDEDVRSMTAIKVSKLISRKSANPSRKLTVVRTVIQ